jgi:hypothetical protein
MTQEFLISTFVAGAHGDLASVDLAKIDSGIASETVPAGTQRRASWIHPRRWLTAVVVVAVGLAVKFQEVVHSI